MRFKMYNGSGYGLNGLKPAGGAVDAPVYLPSNPTNALHAVTKDYVDQVLGHIPAANITGSIPAERLPAFFGTDIASPGYGIFELKPTGVTPGVYNKITVNSKGLVTYGEYIDYTVLTNVLWSDITLDKPTTLEGYGITDALKTTGGTMTGPLYLPAATSQSMQLVNKAYVDTAVAARSSQGRGRVGDIIQSTSSTTPTNHLRTNGAVLDKTTYAALYAILGDTYSNSGDMGYMGQPWRQQAAFNVTQSTDITGWSAGNSLPEPVAYSQAIVTKNRVYLLGGVNNNGYNSTVYTAPINSDGTLGVWTSSTPLPAGIGYAQAIVTKNRVYLLGGLSNLNGTIIPHVFSASINADGTLGVWETAGSLPTAVYASQAVVTKNRVHLLGGQNGGGVFNTVYTAPINSDGTLGSWTAGTSLPGTLYYSHAVVTKNWVYLVGGINDGGQVSSTVYTAPINSDGTLGNWVVGTNLPNPLYGGQAIVTKNRVYLLGGFGGNGPVDAVYTAPINADGTLGVWSAANTTLPSSSAYLQAVTTHSRVYIFGGFYNSQYVGNAWTAAFSGGSSDYVALIATNTVNPSTQFKLPDTTLTDGVGLYSYIRAL